MASSKVKIPYRDLKNKSKEQLLKMKKEIEIYLCNHKLYVRAREKGLSPKEARKNLARIKQRLNELK